jgi:HAD superfamily hydrolase (TIGR01484 family)
MKLANKNLIFLDIDGTLLTPRYKPNSKLVPYYINKLSKKGCLFCINSNRSKEDLVTVIETFGINGPAIGEGAAFFIFKNRQYPIFSQAPITRTIFQALLSASEALPAKIITADTVHFSWRTLASEPRAWVVNKYRKYTASIHVRTHGKPDLLQARKLARLLKTRIPSRYQIQVSSTFCNVLIHPSETDKGKALTYMRRHYFPNAHIVMIGDDAADLSAKKAADSFYAVGNAETKLKKNAAFVAKSQYTKGVVEILKHIDRYGFA